MKLGRSFMNFCRQFLVNVTFAHMCYAKHKTHFIVRNLLGVNDIATHRKSLLSTESLLSFSLSHSLTRCKYPIQFISFDFSFVSFCFCLSVCLKRANLYAFNIERWKINELMYGNLLVIHSGRWSFTIDFELRKGKQFMLR